MRKQTKLVAVLSAAALLAIGASMTSMAASPRWAEEDGVWVYLDEDGERVTNEWKKSNGAWYYLDDNGEMTVDAWIDGDYYVGTDGKMITNNWAELTTEDDNDDPDSDGERWFYFDSKGQKIDSTKKSINGKTYFFDSDGYMEHGWYEDDDSNIYYLGGEDDGARKSGWLWLEADTEEDGVDADCEDCDEEGWYWFDTNGKMFKNAGKKKINGKYYFFNEHGQMLYNWVIVGTDSNAKDDEDVAEDVSRIDELNYAFGVDKGYRVDGWLKIDGSNLAGAQDDTNWYSFDDGEARKADNGFAATPATDARYRERVKVDGKFYCFDQKGKMKDGLQAVAYDADGNYDTYFFDESGAMKTGKVSNVELDNGDTATFYFKSSGANKGIGVTGPQDGYLYFRGMRLEADDDYKFYEVNGSEYLVNKSGKIQVYNKDVTATSAQGKKIDASKIETGSYGNAEYIYLFTDPKGAVTNVFADKDKTDSVLTSINAHDVNADEEGILGWED